jgi:uncharacterized membrane protein YkvA (DUF1232 family)
LGVCQGCPDYWCRLGRDFSDFAYLAWLTTAKAFLNSLFAIAGVLGIYVVSPMDFIPDIIPLLGQSDDALATVLAIINGIAGILLYLKGRSSTPQRRDPGKTDLSKRR